MQSNTSPFRRHVRYHSEFRIVITSTSSDTRPEQEMLLKSVFPELRRQSLERGVLMVESDPRWEASRQPGRREEIIRNHTEELNGYRPTFIGILGNGGSISRARTEAYAHMPWLHDMGDDEDRMLAIKLIEHAMEHPLMEERTFLYIPESADGSDTVDMKISAVANKLHSLRLQARSGRFAVRDGIADREMLGAWILSDLLAALNRLHPLGTDLPLLERWRASHEMFAAAHRRAYVEILRYFDHLSHHAASDNPPIFITGEAGAGKSALLANWTVHHRIINPDVPIICHYVGALAVENDHTSVLRHIMAEIGQLCDITEPLPDDSISLVAAFPLWLERCRDQHVIIIIDGLDHLDAGSHSLDWLPPDIPRNIRLVVSTAAEGPSGEEIRGHLIDREWEEHRIAPLTLTQQHAIIERMVMDTGGDLNSDLLQHFTLGGAVSLPLFLRMSVHQLQKTPTTGERDKLLASRTHEEFFEQMFDQLEAVHGQTFVRDVLTLIWGARGGLQEMELRQLTGTDALTLGKLLTAINHYLIKRDNLLAFIHNYIRMAVERRYLSMPADRRRVHRRLARHVTAMPCSLRRASEEPWQWKLANDRGHLAACLADIPMFMLLSAENSRHELSEYWAYLKDEKLLVHSYESSFNDWRLRNPDKGEQAAVAERLGIFFVASGLLEQAEYYLRFALQLNQELHGHHHLDTAGTLYQLAELLRQATRFAEADELYCSALAILESDAEAAPLLIAKTLSDLGLLYRDWGRHQSALPFYQRAMELKERACGADHPSTAESLNDLALLYQDLHDFDMAIPLYKRALQIRERRLGPHHPATATTLNNLAGTFRASGNLDEAEANYRRALVIRERILGRDHQNTLITVANMASLLQARNNFPESRKMFERAIESTIARLGEDHSNTIHLRTSYAILLRDSGEYAAADEILRHTIPIARQSLGEFHPMTGICINNLAGVLRKMDRDDKAAPLYKEAIAIWEISLGPEHPYILFALETLAVIHLRWNLLDDAEHYIRRALSAWEQSSNPDMESTEHLQKLLKDILQAKG